MNEGEHLDSRGGYEDEDYCKHRSCDGNCKGCECERTCAKLEEDYEDEFESENF